MSQQQAVSARKERPILFSAPMVRAILDGRKTQTRRIVKPQFDDSDGLGVGCDYNSEFKKDGTFGPRFGDWQFTDRSGPPRFCPYGSPGDRLWVRESFWEGTLCYTDPSGEAVGFWSGKVQYLEERESPGPWSLPYGSSTPWMLKRPSIHMRRSLSRIDLEVTCVRVERLNQISPADATAEGIERVRSVGPMRAFGFRDYGGGVGFIDPIKSFASLWDSINGAGSWGANPWVWVVEFKRVPRGEA